MGESIQIWKRGIFKRKTEAMDIKNQKKSRQLCPGLFDEYKRLFYDTDFFDFRLILC